MTLLRRLALSCLLAAGLAGCTEGQKSNPLPRASGTTAAERRPDLNQGAIPAPRQGGTARDTRTFNPDTAPEK